MKPWTILALSFFAPLALLILIGCATIFSSGPQTLTLKSNPTGAAYQYGVYSGKTPDTLEA